MYVLDLCQAEIQLIGQTLSEVSTILDHSRWPALNDGDAAVVPQSRNIIRNKVLFQFGVMLFELAYARPLRTMQKPQDIDEQSSANTDYHTAERIQKSVAREINPSFAEIVRKCIECDFGHGKNLDSRELQEAFYENVVAKLHSIEKKLRSLWEDDDD